MPLFVRSGSVTEEHRDEVWRFEMARHLMTPMTLNIATGKKVPRYLGVTRKLPIFDIKIPARLSKYT